MAFPGPPSRAVIRARVVRRSRLACVAAGLLVLVAASGYLAVAGPRSPLLPGCLFHRWTGLDCPGCGLTRAVHALLHGEFGTAFRFNPVGLVLLPLALAGLAPMLLDWVMPPGPGWRWEVGPRGGRLLAWGLIAFWILRNTPWWPWPLPS